MAIVYNVQVHPIYAGHINDHKVISEHEFSTEAQARAYVQRFNADTYGLVIAVYQGAIDDETGENL